MISNNFKSEMKLKGVGVKIIDSNTIEFTKKDKSKVILETSKIRKIFLNSILSHIDNIS